MMVNEDLIGKRFGRLVVLKRLGAIRKGTNVFWLCQCDCGNQTEVSTNYLKKSTKSCGCLQKEIVKKQFTTHGMTNSRLYHIWSGMKDRCTNKNSLHYKRYGGNGIRLTSNWMKFENFKEWALENGYKDDLTIDRIDNDDGYFPGNCRWVTLKVNANNKSNNVFVNINGETRTLSEWAEHCGLKSQTVITRYGRGKRGEELIQPAIYRGGRR